MHVCSLFVCLFVYLFVSFFVCFCVCVCVRPKGVCELKIWKSGGCKQTAQSCTNEKIEHGLAIWKGDIPSKYLPTIFLADLSSEIYISLDYFFHFPLSVISDKILLLGLSSVQKNSITKENEIEFKHAVLVISNAIWNPNCLDWLQMIWASLLRLTGWDPWSPLWRLSRCIHFTYIRLLIWRRMWDCSQ